MRLLGGKGAATTVPDGRVARQDRMSVSSAPPADRLRVVFIDHVARLSGGEIALLRLLRALAAQVDCHVVLAEDGPLVERLRELGVGVEIMPLSPGLRDMRKDRIRAGRIDLIALARLPIFVFRLSRRIRAIRPDLVHTNSLKSALYGGAAGRMAGVPVVWHIRDRIAPDYLPRNAVRLVHLAARVLPAAVIANSNSTLETLPGIRRGRVLYNPILIPDSVEESPGSVPRVSGTTVVGIIGRLAEWKGQHVFLEAFADAFAGTDVRGRVIGSALFGEDAYAHGLEEQAERLGIASQIEFCGFREDIWEELNQLDVLVHCSVTPEPFGQVVLEGMAAGLPVIASAAGGPAELITSGIDGLLTPPGDAVELAAALRQLHNSTELRTELARAARVRSLAFTPARAAAQLLTLYEDVLAKR